MAARTGRSGDGRDAASSSRRRGPVVMKRNGAAAVCRIRRRVEMAARTGRSGDGRDAASSSRRRGPVVMKRNGRYYFEVRARHETNKNYKISVYGFDGNTELVKMAHDAAMRCNLGEVAYLALDDTKLHYPKNREFLADRFRQDKRMAELTSEHRDKCARGVFWDKEMKEKLRKLAADALEWINDTTQGVPTPQPVDCPMREAVQNYTAQGAPAPQPVCNQNINGNTSCSNVAAMSDIAGSSGREGGADQDNWQYSREAAKCVPMHLQWSGDNQAVSIFPSQEPDLWFDSDSQWCFQADLAGAMAFREVALDTLRPINNSTQGAAAAQPVDSQMREVASDAVQNYIAQGAAAAQPVNSRNINDGYGDEGPRFVIDDAIGPEYGAAPENWPHMIEALRSILPELPELPVEDHLDTRWIENASVEAENRKLKAENRKLKAENSELKAVWGDKARLEAEIEVLKARLASQCFPESHGLQPPGDMVP